MKIFLQHLGGAEPVAMDFEPTATLRELRKGVSHHVDGGCFYLVLGEQLLKHGMDDLALSACGLEEGSAVSVLVHSSSFPEGTFNDSCAWSFGHESFDASISVTIELGEGDTRDVTWTECFGGFAFQGSAKTTLKGTASMEDNKVIFDLAGETFASPPGNVGLHGGKKYQLQCTACFEPDTRLLTLQPVTWPDKPPGGHAVLKHLEVLKEEKELKEKSEQLCRVNYDRATAADEVGQILAGRADPNLFRGSKTPLHRAVAAGNVEAAKVLLERNADVTARDNSARPSQGDAPLETAAGMRNGNVDMVKLLIAGRADVRGKTRNGGNTALHLAAFNAHVEIVKVLIEAGSDPNAKTSNKHYLALDLAKQCKSLAKQREYQEIEGLLEPLTMQEQ